MTRGEAPSLDAQMAAFKGFTVQDGEVASVQDGAAPKDGAAEGKEAKKPAEGQAEQGENGDQGGDQGQDGENGDQGGDQGQDGAKKPVAGADEHKQPREAEFAKARGALKAMNRRLADAQAEASALEAKIASLKSGLTGTASGDTPADGAPDPQSFQLGELDPGYIRALARYEVKQALALNKKASDEARHREAASVKAEERVQALDAFAEAGQAKFDDFEEVVIESAKAGKWPLTQALGELLLESDLGHEIAHHLATNPDEAQRVAAKSPASQAAWFGRMEAKFEAQAASQPGEKPPVKAPKAPPPLKQPRGGNGQFDASPDTTDFAAFEAKAMGRR